MPCPPVSAARRQCQFHSSAGGQKRLPPGAGSQSLGSAVTRRKAGSGYRWDCDDRCCCAGLGSMTSSTHPAAEKVATTVLHVGGQGWASEKAVVEQMLGRRPGVRLVEANPVAQTATVTFDTGQTSVAELRRWVRGFRVAAPFGLRDDVWLLLLSLPVIFYSAWIFFEGAYRALRALTLDMMVLVAVAVGAGWLYSLAVTLTGGGDTFYEAATVLAAFVLLGHWFEMRARGGANDAIRALLDLAPPQATVIRGGETIEVPTAEGVAGDLLLVRPGDKVGTDGVVEEGHSEVDESVVTGESLPVSKAPRSPVIGATINK